MAQIGVGESVVVGAGRSRRLVWAAALALVVGCGNTATIVRTSGAPIESKIVGSSGRNVYVEGNGERETIPRDEIADVDHPGNVAAVIGGLLTVYGIVNIAVGAPQCGEKGGAFCTGVFLPAAIGVPLTIYGVVVYTSSTSALGAPPSRRYATRLVLQPTTHVDGQASSPGLVLGGTF